MLSVRPEDNHVSVFKKLLIQKFFLHTNKKKSFPDISTLESVFKKFRFRGSGYSDLSVLVWAERLI